ncbi:hypothetical protein CAC42_5819 [Sphaceloma murrayae]|uniref:Uncharacterized protein n=1 Tax=Sphaceloma murrayae TaxID=2082308 RepID=A0A2K1QZC3_9PEZI|nr:hypothetical protein CAC42_5819 [Sphaceloma murrayae]
MAANSNSSRPRSGTTSSIQSVTRSVRSASGRILDADIPHGMWAATAAATSMAPSLSDIRRGSFGQEGWNSQVQQEHTAAPVQQSQTGAGRRPSSALLGRFSFKGSPPLPEGKEATEPFPAMTNAEKGIAPVSASSTEAEAEESLPKTSTSTNPDAVKSATTDEIIPTKSSSTIAPQQRLATQKSFPNGYVVPPKKPWTESTAIGLKAFWKWFLTPFGFLVTLYGLNVVAWGGMLFLILLNAAPAMCSPNLPRNNFDGCNDIDSPRRIWVEITSQILNALFCVTGFGLIPWRFRDLYFLLRFRLANERKVGRAKKLYGLRKLAGINSGWFRLPGSDTLDELSPSAYLASRAAVPAHEIKNTDPAAVELGTDPETQDERLPLPLSKSPAPPLTGVRAPPTRLWLLDFVIWCNVWNTFFQACLCGFMWGMNRIDRPSWSTGLFVALACGIAGVGGITMFVQGKRVKKVEGVRPDGGTGDEAAIGVAGEGK